MLEFRPNFIEKIKVDIINIPVNKAMIILKKTAITVNTNKGGNIMAKVVLFTGAGASYPLELPTTEVLFRKIKQKEINVSKQELFNAISNLENVRDIEHIWYILEKMEEIDKINQEFPFLGNYARILYPPNVNKEWQPTINDIKNLKISIENIIFQQYTLPIDKAPDAIILYKKIIDYMITQNETDNTIDIPVFTTNYDRILDEVGSDLHERLGFKIIDGFEEQGRKPLLWNEKVFSKSKGKQNYFAFQLHGSLKWRINSAGNIVKLDSEDIQRNSKTHPQRLLIYPGSIKNPDRDPFQTLHVQLKSYLKVAEKCIVIGFSFRDSHLNEVFFESMKNNPRLKVIIVSPNAQKNLNSNELYAKIKKDKRIKVNRITTISNPFEKLKMDDLVKIK